MAWPYINVMNEFQKKVHWWWWRRQCIKSRPVWRFVKYECWVWIENKLLPINDSQAVGDCVDPDNVTCSEPPHSIFVSEKCLVILRVVMFEITLGNMTPANEQLSCRPHHVIYRKAPFIETLDHHQRVGCPNASFLALLSITRRSCLKPVSFHGWLISHVVFICFILMG